MTLVIILYLNMNSVYYFLKNTKNKLLFKFSLYVFLNFMNEYSPDLRLIIIKILLILELKSNKIFWWLIEDEIWKVSV